MFNIVRYVVIGVAAASLTLSAADMVSGTWKLNAAKSKYNPGPPPKSLTVVYQMEGDWVTTKSDAVDSTGKASSYTNRYKWDGKVYPYKTLQVDGTISAKRIDDFHIEATLKGGKGSMTSHAVVSGDGKTRTLTTKGTNAEGKPVNTVAVYDKQ